MKRLAIGFLLFVVLILLWHAPALIIIYRSVSNGRASGIGFVAGSPVENIVRILILLFLGVIAYWISGKLIKAN